MNEIQYAVQEACSMNLSTEQSIKFVMRVSNCNREIANKQSIIVLFQHTMKQQTL
jgi:hypothetical protein